MSNRFAISLAALLALAACSGGTVWVKEGVSREQIRADEAVCRSLAEASQTRSTAITSDIRGSIRGGRDDARQLVTSTRDIEAARSHSRIIERCMIARGYTRPAS